MSVANECIPFYEPGKRITFEATAAVTGKRFLGVSGARASGENVQAAHAGAGDPSIGVASFDVALGDLGTAISGGVVPVTAGATVTAGEEVEADANGKAIPLASGKALGLALDDAALNADAQIKLY